MMNRRAAQTMRWLALTSLLLLLCAINVAVPGEAVNKRNIRMRGPVGSLPSPSHAQISGDGLIAFSADDQLCLMNADGSDLTCLTNDPPGVHNRYPAFSPDASRIAFIRDDEGSNDHALYLIGTDGSGLQRLTSSPVALGEPAWSPDGTRIAFVRGYDTTSNGYANLTTCGQEIHVIDILGLGEELDLTQGAGGTDPAWSPDGTHIAFVSTRDNGFELYVMDADGSKVQRLTNTEWAEAEPAWSPDGRQIAYTANLLPGNFNCGFMSTGLSGQRATPNPSIYIMNADGTNQTMLEGTEGGIEPVWSPDGTRLALSLYGKGGWQIYAINADGTGLTKLTSGPTQKASPSWAVAGGR